MSNAIFLSINQYYYNYCVLFLKSLSQYYPDHPDVLLHYYDLSDQQIDVLSHFSRLNLFPVNIELIQQWPGITFSGGFKHAAACYARYWAWSDKFNEYDTLLFMDVDVLVLGDLSDCFSKNNFSIGICGYQKKDMFFKDPEDVHLKAMLKDDRIDVAKVNRNAGIMVIPRKYRGNEALKQLINLTDRYSEYISMADQSIINIWLAANKIMYEPLELKYNFQPGFFDFKFYSFKDLKDIHVFHFAGLWQKPFLRLSWMRVTLCLSGTPFYILYMSILNITYMFLYRTKKLFENRGSRGLNCDKKG